MGKVKLLSKILFILRNVIRYREPDFNIYQKETEKYRIYFHKKIGNFYPEIYHIYDNLSIFEIKINQSKKYNYFNMILKDFCDKQKPSVLINKIYRDPYKCSYNVLINEGFEQTVNTLNFFKYLIEEDSEIINFLHSALDDALLELV